jgi:hypothetical protein
MSTSIFRVHNCVAIAGHEAKMDAIHSFEMSIPKYQNTRCHKGEDYNELVYNNAIILSKCSKDFGP